MTSQSRVATAMPTLRVCACACLDADAMAQGEFVAGLAQWLPKRTRGRASVLTKMVAELAQRVAQDAQAPLSETPLVVGSAYGELSTTMDLLAQMHDVRGQLSPARFQASVHNTAASVLSISSGARGFSTSVAAGPATAAAVLLEASALLACGCAEVIAIVADEALPAFLDDGQAGHACAAAFLLRLESADSLTGDHTTLWSELLPSPSSAPSPNKDRRHCAAELLELVAAITAGRRETVELPRIVGALRVRATPSAAATPSWPPIEVLLPHGPPMRLLDRVLAYDAQRAICEVVLTPDAMFIEDGRVPAWAAIEYCAQCVAAFAGMAGHLRGEAAKLGMLVAVREMSLEVDSFAPGDTLEVEATLDWGQARLGRFACEVRRSGVLVAQATLSVYQPEQPDAEPPDTEPQR